MEQLEVWEQDRDRWRWRYSAGPKVELVSNQLYDDPAEAEQAARHAYPDIRLETPAQLEAVEDRKRLLVTLVVLVLTAIGIAIWLQTSRGSEVTDRTAEEGS